LIVVPAAAETRPLIPLTFALLGDTPYGDDQRAAFPTLVADVNADRRIRMVLHAGAVKDGSSTCDDARFADLAGLYNTFQDPFVLTPGDKEWTDCHRVTAGQYLPTGPGLMAGRRFRCRRAVTDELTQPGRSYYREIRTKGSGS
jgi:hypothetical protein